MSDRNRRIRYYTERDARRDRLRRRVRRAAPWLALVLLALGALLLVGCSDGNAQALTLDDLFPPLTPTAASVSAETPTPAPSATPTPAPSATPTPTPAPTPATGDGLTPETAIVVQSAESVTANGRWYRIVRGDSLWRIARAALRNANADASNAAVARYVDRIVEGNRWLLPNPDLIHPNETVLLPTQ